MEKNLAATPRINGAMFPTHIGQTVRVVGQVTSVNGEQVQLNCSDGVIVNALIRQEVELPINSVIEITGKINGTQVWDLFCCSSSSCC